MTGAELSRVLVCLASLLRDSAQEEVEGWDAPLTFRDAITACDKAAEELRAT